MKFLKCDNKMILVDNITHVEIEKSKIDDGVMLLEIYAGGFSPIANKVLKVKGKTTREPNGASINYVMHKFYMFLNAFKVCTPINLEFEPKINDDPEYSSESLSGIISDETNDFLDIEYFVEYLKKQVEENKAKEIGYRIHELRKRSGLTQHEMAEIIYGNGRCRSRISEYEGGVRIPPIDKLEKIAIWGGVTVDFLLYGKGAIIDDATSKDYKTVCTDFKC